MKQLNVELDDNTVLVAMTILVDGGGGNPILSAEQRMYTSENFTDKPEED